MNIANSKKIEVEINGISYEATYTVWKDVVNLEFEGETKSTQVGGLTPDNVAIILLKEIINNK